MIVYDAGMNSAEDAPSTAATRARAARELVWSAANTANTAVSTHRTPSETSMIVRGRIRSASTPPTVVSAARGIP
jgi:hypothetical protein